MKILIDAGHGIDTPGKRSPDSFFLEYLWNRQVADIVLTRMQRAGMDADLVVTQTNDIPLKTRVNRINGICNSLGAENVLLLSIHSNAAGDGSQWMTAQGWSAYTTIGQTESDKVAECFYDVFEADFKDRKIRKDLQDGDRDYEENFYIIQKSKCPAILLENFFYDNKDECKWLLTEDAKQRIAAAIVKATKRYLNR